MTLSPADVLAALPGWEDATCMALTGGLTNETWRVTTGDKTGVLKIDDAPRDVPFNTRSAEARVQNAAAGEGLSPGVILAGDRFYFTDFVAGNVWTRDSLGKEGNLELVATALRRVHALPLTGRTFDASVAAKRYVERVAGLDNRVIETCIRIIGRMRLPRNLCCCHNDLVAENLIATPDLMFLDWEYACDNDPFFDLATVVEHHELSDAQVTVLLDAYLGGDGRGWRQHLEQQRVLYLALLCLWMGSRADSDPMELGTVASRLITSCF